MRSATLRKFSLEASAARADQNDEHDHAHPDRQSSSPINCQPEHWHHGPGERAFGSIRQFGLCALAAIVSGLIAAAIIALQTAFYLDSLHY
jgi:hypothetical protein